MYRTYYVHLVGIKRSDCLYKLVRTGGVLSTIQVRHHPNTRVPPLESNCLVPHKSSLNSEAFVYAMCYMLKSMCWCVQATNWLHGLTHPSFWKKHGFTCFELLPNIFFFLHSRFRALQFNYHNSRQWMHTIFISYNITKHQLLQLLFSVHHLIYYINITQWGDFGR
jgi:hypothetical protein